MVHQRDKICDDEGLSVAICSGLQQCATVETDRGTYSISRLIKDGPLRAVFLVRNLCDVGSVYVMKVERRFLKSEDTVIKKEAAILQMFMERPKDVNHFPELVDRGRKERYNFVIVQLLGKTLADLKASLITRVFSIGTGVRVALQCLEAISELHLNGIVHRDIKPSNFAMGLQHESNVVFMLDFRLSRRFLNKNNEILKPRRVVGFKGTIKFAPISGHKRMEQFPKDDCESWFYMLLDFVHPQGLPWQKLADKDEVQFLKLQCRLRKGLLLGHFKCAKDFARILDYIDGLVYDDRVDYGFLASCLDAAAVVYGVDPDGPFDWEVSEYEVVSQAPARTSVKSNVAKQQPRKPAAAASSSLCNIL